MSVVTHPGARTSVPRVELRIAGRLDVACLPAVRTVLDAAVQLRPDELVIGLAECTGIDAAAIGLLLDVHRDLLRAGSSLTLHAPSPRLLRILAIARVAHVLRILPEDAPAGPLDAIPAPAAGPAAQPGAEATAGRDNHRWPREGGTA